MKSLKKLVVCLMAVVLVVTVAPAPSQCNMLGFSMNLKLPIEPISPEATLPASAYCCTGIKAALLPYCDNNTNNIKIRMNRNTVIYNDVPLHSINIVVNSAYDDETIAKKQFNQKLVTKKPYFFILGLIINNNKRIGQYR